VVDETCIDLEEPSDCALAVSAARSMAGQAGFNTADQVFFATAVSELATNIVRYAGRGGRVTLRILHNLENVGLEVAAQDSGPGIENVEAAMTDHFSSGDSLGLGLPSVKRIMDEFEIQSEPGRGTLIVGRKWRA